ncbi:TPA: ABC transporter ATP-binding protein [Clostridium botulinum]|nr:ABC transporter ATP-binding protein [Clostridium botulinum]
MKFKDSIIKIKSIISLTSKTIKIMWKSSKLGFIMSFVTTIFNGIIVPLNMMVSKYFIDSVIGALSNKNNESFQNKVFFWLAIEFVIIVFSLFINRLATYLYDIQTRYLNTYISKLLIKKENELDLSYFENHEFHNKMQQANDQSVSSTYQVIDSLMQIIKNCSTLVGAIIIVINLNPIIVFLCILTPIPMCFINIKISKMKYDVYKKTMEKSRLAGYLQAMMMDYNTVKEIKLNRLGNYFEKVIVSILNKNTNLNKKVGKVQVASLSSVDLLSTIVSYCYKIYVIFITLTKNLSIGTMNMYMSALSNVDSSIRNILNSFSSLYSNNLYIENLFYVLNLKPKIFDSENSKMFHNTIADCIEFRNVSFKYPNSDKYILKNINLKINAGDTCAIVGLNGSGKTTMIKLLARLYEPTEGEIYIDGINIKDYKIESLYKYMNIVFQDFVKYPFSIKDNIGFGDIDNLNNMKLIEEASKKANAYNFIQELDNKFDTRLEKLWVNGTDLSLGQWQKLAVSRAFMNNSAILILDEPTASIDAQAEYQLFSNFKQLTKNRTSVLISHRFSTVKVADVIVVLKDGKIIENGTHVELMMKNGFYSNLYNMQAEAYMDETYGKKVNVN